MRPDTNGVHRSSRTIGTAIAIGAFAAITSACAPLPVLDPDDGSANSVQLERGTCVEGLSSAQFRSQVAPPESMQPGTTAHVSVTFDNCSGVTWTGGDFSLVPTPHTTSARWNVPRIRLMRDVPEGARVTIPFDIVAPLESGTYDFTWAISREGSGLMQEPSTLRRVVVRTSADCSREGPVARFVGQAAPPSFVGVGESVHGTVTFANCSTETWTRGGDLHLVSALEMNASPWITTRVELDQDVPPGAEVTIAIDGTAPSAPGVYDFTWVLATGGDETPVGEPSLPVEITALQRADCESPGATARFVGQHAPAAMDADVNADVDVTFANCGTSVWTSDYRINAAAPATPGLWDAQNIELPFDVGPGFAVKTRFRIHSPGSSGSFPYRWAITASGVALDDPSPLSTVTVREPAISCGAVQWWTASINGGHQSGPWTDTDLNVHANTPVVLRNAARLESHPVGSCGYAPVFTDMTNGGRFRFFHLRPQNQYATENGRIYPRGFVVGLSGGDTYDTGYPSCSSGAHLCVQTIGPYRSIFPYGYDSCR